MSANQNIPGYIEILTCTLATQAGTINLINHVKSFSLYESIYQPAYYLEMFISESRALMDTLPIVGDERMTLSFKTPSLEPLEVELIVTNINSATNEQTVRHRGYTIIAASVEVLANKTNFIQKAYNTNISSMIEDITKTYLMSSKPLDIMETRGIQRIIIPNLRPYNAIDMLRRRAIANGEESSLFFFYENRDGLHFKTLEKLMHDGVVGRRTYTNDATINTDVLKSPMRNILGFHQRDLTHHAHNVGSGSLNTRVATFDYRTLTYRREDVDVDERRLYTARGNMTRVNTERFRSDWSSRPGAVSFIPVDSDRPETFIPTVTPYHRAAAAIFAQGALELRLFGDSTLSVGQKFKAEIWENKGSTDNPEIDRMIADEYLLTSIRHMVEPMGVNPRYTCIIEGIKGGYDEEIV